MIVVVGAQASGGQNMSADHLRLEGTSSFPFGAAFQLDTGSSRQQLARFVNLALSYGLLGFTVATGPAWRALLAASAATIATALVWQASPAAVSEPRPAQRFAAEIDRSRRYGHVLTLVRISGAASRTAISSSFRTADIIWSDGDHLYVAMPETDSEAAWFVVNRLLVSEELTATAVTIASFPEDALTTHALLAATADPVSLDLRDGAVELPYLQTTQAQQTNGQPATRPAA